MTLSLGYGIASIIVACFYFMIYIALPIALVLSAIGYVGSRVFKRFRKPRKTIGL